ncbi:hypothetical protein BSLA_03r1204 [Burkholderia stabilis]|nr:hypothetical protein BSLA_03r1204 [Burkholderia stabilis]
MLARDAPLQRLLQRVVWGDAGVLRENGRCTAVWAAARRKKGGIRRPLGFRNARCASQTLRGDAHVISSAVREPSRIVGQWPG